MPAILVSNFYKFVTLTPQDIDAVCQALTEIASQTGMRGLIVIAPEGINTTLSGDVEVVRGAYKALAQTAVGPIEPKESWAPKQPFRRFKIDRRPEIVTLGGAITPDELASETLLTPKQWHEELTHAQTLPPDQRPVLIDVRNRYETRLGKFTDAIDPDLGSFRAVEKFFKEHEDLKSRPVYMYCTGGIRCEKAVPWLKQRGFKNLKQLHGGILRYLEQYPQGHFNGECFVFDHRVSVDGELKPTSRYKLCPLCGDPGERKVTCQHCGKSTVICDTCECACSKNCHHHMHLTAAKKGRQAQGSAA